MDVITHLPPRIPMMLGMDWMDPLYLLDRFGQQMFWISLVIIFVECGLLFPFLPGDSLLFFLGIFIGAGDIDTNIVVACVSLSTAALAGNVAGYEIGRVIGPPVFDRDGRLLNQRNLRKTREFFETHGTRALILGRFVPFVRTFVTLVAGASRMGRAKFVVGSAIGAVLWATGLTLLGYFLGNTRFLQDHIEASLLLIVAFSLLPPVVAFLRRRGEHDGSPESVTSDD